MSDLNAFILGANLQPSLAARLRAYFRYQQLGQSHDWTSLLARMSPALRGQVAIQLHSVWIEETDLFRSNCQRTMLIRLSFSFRAEAYPPEELLVRSGDFVSQLFVIRKGMVFIMPLDRSFHVRHTPRAHPHPHPPCTHPAPAFTPTHPALAPAAPPCPLPPKLCWLFSRRMRLFAALPALPPPPPWLHRCCNLHV